MMLQADSPRDYVVATGISHSVEELLEVAFRHVELDYREFVRIDSALIRPAEVDYLCGDSTRAREALGWRPRTSFEELIAMMVEADLENNRRNPHSAKTTAGF